MNIQDTATILAKVKLGDNREVSELVLKEWHDTIGHLDREDAMRAVTMHRIESSAYLQPAHIVANVKRIRADEQRHTPIVPVKQTYPYPANLEAWSAAHASPIEFARQEAIYHQLCRDEGFDPHDAVNGYPYKCRSCVA